MITDHSFPPQAWPGPRAAVVGGAGRGGAAAAGVGAGGGGPRRDGGHVALHLRRGQHSRAGPGHVLHGAGGWIYRAHRLELT